MRLRVDSSICRVFASSLGLHFPSLLTATTLTFSFSPVYVGALFGTAVIVWQVTSDGEATYFEGAALVGAFVVLATVAWFGT